MRANFINESLQNIFKPKSREEIINHPDFWDAEPDKILNFGLIWKDLDIIKKATKKIERSFQAYPFQYNFYPFLRSTPEIKKYIRNYLLKANIVASEYILLAGVNTNDRELILAGIRKSSKYHSINYVLKSKGNFKKLSQENLDFILDHVRLENSLLRKISMQRNIDTYILKDRDKFYPSLKNIPDKELKNYLTSTGLSPQKGYKLYKILEFINNNNPRYTDMIKFAYEFTHGEGSYSYEDRGYYSTNFSRGIYSRGAYGKYLEKENGLYKLSIEGLQKMKDLEKTLAPKMPRLFNSSF